VVVVQVLVGFLVGIGFDFLMGLYGQFLVDCMVSLWVLVVVWVLIDCLLVLVPDLAVLDQQT
jgi:hypothetical protein